MSAFKFHYFDGRGRGELTRLIFVASGTPFEDHRVSYEKEWPHRKNETPIGQMPYLEYNGTVLPQSIAIARFIAKENNLAGQGNLEQAQADAIVDTIVDLINYYYSKIFGAPDMENLFKQFLANQGASAAANVEKLIGMYSKADGFSVGKGLTWADLLIFDIGSAILDKVPEFQTKYPKLAAVHLNVSNNARVAEYIKNRKVTPW